MYVEKTLFTLFIFILPSSLFGDFSQQLLTVGQPPVLAKLIACDQQGNLQFLVDEEEKILDIASLIRWSNPKVNIQNCEIILIDDSRLVVTKSWTGQNDLQKIHRLRTAAPLSRSPEGFREPSVPGNPC